MAFGGPSAHTGHLGGRTGLIQEHQPGDIECGLSFFPFSPLGLDVRTLLLAGVSGFFYRSTPTC